MLTYDPNEVSAAYPPRMIYLAVCSVVDPPNVIGAECLLNRGQKGLHKRSSIHGSHGSISLQTAIGLSILVQSEVSDGGARKLGLLRRILLCLLSLEASGQGSRPLPHRARGGPSCCHGAVRASYLRFLNRSLPPLYGVFVLC
jgi:hypothetical protein